MKRLLLIPLFAMFAVTAQAQQYSFGLNNAQVEVSLADGYKTASLVAAHDEQVAGPIMARLSLGAGVIEYTGAELRHSHDYGGSDLLYLNLKPSVMLGLRIPLDDRLNLGVYSGYESNINKYVSHKFVPLSVSLSF